MPPSPYHATIRVAPTKGDVPPLLHDAMISSCASAIEARGCFTIALSGGSLPSFLSALPASFAARGVDPRFDRWHLCLADERLVPSTDGDSNLKSIRENFLDAMPEGVKGIPHDQVHGINEALLDPPSPSSDEKIAAEYQADAIEPVLALSGGMLDCVLLGFGPDGHTCSLFPGHQLLTEETLLVASIGDSPKPPPRRITLTFPVLKCLSRHVIFCGAGSSKGPILRDSFAKVKKVANVTETSSSSGETYDAELADPPPYPCAMVRPRPAAAAAGSGGGVCSSGGLTWIVDLDAAKDLLDRQDQACGKL